MVTMETYSSHSLIMGKEREKRNLPPFAFSLGGITDVFIEQSIYIYQTNEPTNGHTLYFTQVLHTTLMRI